MTDTIENRLKNLGISIPQAAAPLPTMCPLHKATRFFSHPASCRWKTANWCIRGLIGKELTVADGQAAARACVINVLAQAKAALGELDRIKRIIEDYRIRRFGTRFRRTASGGQWRIGSAGRRSGRCGQACRVLP